jgi:hypothetical protein
MTVRSRKLLVTGKASTGIHGSWPGRFRLKRSYNVRHWKSLTFLSLSHVFSGALSRPKRMDSQEANALHQNSISVAVSNGLAEETHANSGPFRRSLNRQASRHLDRVRARCETGRRSRMKCVLPRRKDVGSRDHYRRGGMLDDRQVPSRRSRKFRRALAAGKFVEKPATR